MPSFKIFAGHVFVVKNVGFVDYFVVIFITPLELLPVELLSFWQFQRYRAFLILVSILDNWDVSTGIILLKLRAAMILIFIIIREKSILSDMFSCFGFGRMLMVYNIFDHYK